MVITKELSIAPPRERAGESQLQPLAIPSGIPRSRGNEIMEDQDRQVQMFIAQASTNADMLRRFSVEYGPEELVAMVRATGAVAESEAESVAAALGAAGYTNTALLADLDAKELRTELQEQGKELAAPVVRTLVRNVMLSTNVLGYSEIRAGIADAAVNLSEGRQSRRGSLRRMASMSASAGRARVTSESPPRARDEHDEEVVIMEREEVSGATAELQRIQEEAADPNTDPTADPTSVGEGPEQGGHSRVAASEATMTEILDGIAEGTFRSVDARQVTATAQAVTHKNNATENNFPVQLWETPIPEQVPEMGAGQHLEVAGPAVLSQEVLEAIATRPSPLQVRSGPGARSDQAAPSQEPSFSSEQVTTVAGEALSQTNSVAATEVLGEQQQSSAADCQEHEQGAFRHHPQAAFATPGGAQQQQVQQGGEGRSASRSTELSTQVSLAVTAAMDTLSGASDDSWIQEGEPISREGMIAIPGSGAWMHTAAVQRAAMVAAMHCRLQDEDARAVEDILQGCAVQHAARILQMKRLEREQQQLVEAEKQAMQAKADMQGQQLQEQQEAAEQIAADMVRQQMSHQQREDLLMDRLAAGRLTSSNAELGLDEEATFQRQQLEEAQVKAAEAEVKTQEQMKAAQELAADMVREQAQQDLQTNPFIYPPSQQRQGGKSSTEQWAVPQGAGGTTRSSCGRQHGAGSAQSGAVPQPCDLPCRTIAGASTASSWDAGCTCFESVLLCSHR